MSDEIQPRTYNAWSLLDEDKDWRGRNRVTATMPVRDGVIIFTRDWHVIYRWKPSRLARLRRFLKL